MVDVHALGRFALGSIGSGGAIVCGPSGSIALRPGNGSPIARAPADRRIRVGGLEWFGVCVSRCVGGFWCFFFLVGLVWW